MCRDDVIIQSNSRINHNPPSVKRTSFVQSLATLSTPTTRGVYLSVLFDFKNYRFSIFKYAKSITKSIRCLLQIFSLSVLVFNGSIFGLTNKKIFSKLIYDLSNNLTQNKKRLIQLLIECKILLSVVKVQKILTIENPSHRLTLVVVVANPRHHHFQFFRFLTL